MIKTYEDLMLGDSAWLLELEAPALYTKTEVLQVIKESVKILPAENNLEIKIETRNPLVFEGEKANTSGIFLLFLAPENDKENAEALALLDKMAAAMGLLEGQYQKVFSNHFLAAIMQTLPKVVVGLGVLVNQTLLLNKEKLASMRGHDYPLFIVDQKDQEHHFLLTPLFHPDFLLINPNMKKMAWEDLQRIQNVLR